MLKFAWFVAQVVVVAFALFTLARALFMRMVPTRGWSWVMVVGGLGLAIMLTHRAFGSTITPPAYTALLFLLTISGIAPNNTDTGLSPAASKIWTRRGAVSIAIGTAVGWLSFASVVSV